MAQEICDVKHADRRVRRHRLHDHVVRQLALRILRGEELIPGTALPTEVELSKELKVSRTVLREAVKVLEAKGLVEVRPKVGVTIRPRDEWNVVDPAILAWQSEILPDQDFIRDLCEFRRAVEPVAAELAARRGTDAEIQALLECLARMEATVGDRQAFIAADLEFHTGIFVACHNELLQRINLTVHSALRTSRAITTQRPGSSAAALGLHRDVAIAIRAHDPLAARFAMDQLISRMVLDIEAVFHGDSADVVEGSNVSVS
jgi:GntR family transcriptional regulator, galactonate operon transcriptional repressor